MRLLKKETWEILEKYIDKYVGIPISYGIFPECFEAEMARIDKK